MPSFEGLNAQVLGISIDHIPCLRAWADSLGGIHFPLLSDFWPHGATAERYGVLRPEDGTTERAIFIIDRNGIIRYIDIHAMDEQPDNEELRKALRQIENAPALPGLEKKNGLSGASGIYFGDEDESELPTSGVTLYCARWCKDCKKAKAWLDEHGLTYEEVDIDYSLAARDRIRQWANGKLITPVFDFDGTIVLDYDLPKMEEALRRLTGR